ncbi:MAG: sigma-54-dependent transcriptional regulator [Planctomycetaceae bacterium]
MHSSSLRPDFASAGAIAGRLPATARVLMCVSNPQARSAIEQAAGTILPPESNRTLDHAGILLLREPTSLVIVDDETLHTAANSDSGSRPIREFANALLGNSGCTQLLLISAANDANALPIGLRSEEIAARLTVLDHRDFSVAALQSLITMAIRHADSQQSLPHSSRPQSQAQSPTHSLREVLGGSPRMLKLYESIDSATATDLPILICGESGTGTSLLANAIHDGSSRSAQSFVRVHSRSMSLDQLNDLLCLDVADLEVATLPLDTPPRPAGGTLFLDEFDEFPVALQKPLCRFVARQQELADGSQGRHRSIVRIIASTHQNFDLPTRQTLGLEILVRGLNAERLHVPPVRERPEDIAPLAEQFFIRWALQEDQPRPRLTRNALESLKEHFWPGNLRELYTVLRNTAIVARGNDITADMLHPWLAKTVIPDGTEVPRMTLADMERQLIETTFTRCGGNREKTASSLDIGLRTLSGKLREYGYPPRGGPGSNLKAA